jgi:uncharacterized protein YpuA (DUF1002 family)
VNREVSHLKQFIRIPWARRLLTVAIMVLTLAVLWGPFAGTALAYNRVVTLGADLTPTERVQMLDYFGIRMLRIRQLIITNSQEHQLLDGIAPANEIGTRAISSAYVMPQHTGYGITVTTHNITWVTPAMYKNALATAGLQNAVVRVAAPFPVSGTAALVGIIWAYQAATGHSLSPAQQRAAAQELVVTSQIAHSTGQSAGVVNLVAQVKQEVVNQHLTTPAQIRPVIIRVAANLNIHLTTAQVTSITNMMVQISHLHLSASMLSRQIGGIQSEASQAAGLWQQIVAFFHWIWLRITGGTAAGAVDGRRAHSLDSVHYRP